MILDENKVKHVEDLARLNLNDEEILIYQKQLGAILEDISKIENVDVDSFDMMISPCSDINKYGTEGEMLSREEIFKNVKHERDSYILVPKVIND